MGVSITAKNSSFEFNCGCGGFYNLRKNIALAFDKEFGEHYTKIIHVHDSESSEEFNRKANKILADPRFRKEDCDILDFLFASDCEGSVGYKTCKKIYDLIRNIDFGNKIFTYAAYSDGKDYEHFKDFLLECYSKKRKMIWN